MGDAMDVVALDSGGDAAATRALQMEGGSLPPRKRLLAGLKLNGLLSTSPPPSAAVAEEGCCMGCSAVERSGLRRIKRGGVVLRLCSACTLLYSKSMFCPHCLAMYHDASVFGGGEFLVCTKCRRSVHPECEMKHSGGKLPEASSYVCLDCVNRRQRELANGSGSGVGPALKKPRMHRDRPDGSRFVAPTRIQKNEGGDAASSSPQEAAVMARNAATAARKLAAAAKANAAAKASASVRASAAAKAALEAAAHAAKAEASIRGELRRTRPRLEINVHSEPRRERSFKHEDGSMRRPSVDDEELARQLHRVINSSPRISRSMTPMRRKAKPETPSSGVSNSSAETVRAEHQQQHHQFRQRPRSVTHKEFRRIDSRVSRHEVTTTPIIDPPPPPPPPHEDLAVKSEAMDGVMGPDEASIFFDALVEADGEGMHAAADGAPDQRPDYLQEILEAAVLSDAAMFTDPPHHDLDTVRPEPEPIAADTSSLHIEAPDTVPATMADEVAVAPMEHEVAVTMPVPMEDEVAVAMPASMEHEVAVTMPASMEHEVTVAIPASMEDEVAVTMPASMEHEVAVTIPALMADEVAVAMPASMEHEVAVTMPASMEDEVAVTMPASMEDEVAVTMPASMEDEVAVTMPSDVLATHEVSLEQDVHDVEMQEVTAEHVSTTRVEESSAPVQESTTIEAISGTVEDVEPSVGATEVEVPSMESSVGAAEVEVPLMEPSTGAIEVEVPSLEPLSATEVEVPAMEPLSAIKELEVLSGEPLSATEELEVPPPLMEESGALTESEAQAPVEEVTATEPTCQQSG